MLFFFGCEGTFLSTLVWRSLHTARRRLPSWTASIRRWWSVYIKSTPLFEMCQPLTARRSSRSAGWGFYCSACSKPLLFFLFSCFSWLRCTSFSRSQAQDLWVYLICLITDHCRLLFAFWQLTEDLDMEAFMNEVIEIGTSLEDSTRVSALPSTLISNLCCSLLSGNTWS